MANDIDLIKEAYPLFKECVEALNATPLSIQESMNLSKIFKKRFPIALWGKIDWAKIDHKIEVGYDPQDIMPALEKLIGGTSDTTVYIEWNTMGFPIIKTDIKRVISVFDDVTCVSFEKFIFNVTLNGTISIKT